MSEDRGYREEFKEEVRESTNLANLIGESIELKAKRSGLEYIGLCPFHEDHRPSLHIYQERQSYRCWVCDTGGDCFSWVMQTEQVEFPEALEMLAKRAHIKIPMSHERKKEYTREQALYDAIERATCLFEEQLWKNPDAEKAREYILGERQISQETAKQFRLGYHPNDWRFTLRNLMVEGISEEVLHEARLVGESSRKRKYDYFVDRLTIPIKNNSGRIVGFGGRALGEDNEIKYINSPESNLFQKTRVLYALQEATKPAHKENELIVVEGYLDAISCHQHGLTNTIATMGTAFTTTHAELLQHKFQGHELILLYDGDQGGLDAAQRVVKKLIGRGNTNICILPEDQDPDDILRAGGKSALKQRLKKRIPSFEFYTSRLLKGKDPKKPEHAQKLLETLSQDMPSVPPRVRGIYLEHLSQQTGLTLRTIEGAIQTKADKIITRNNPRAEYTLIRGLVIYPEKRPHFQERHSIDLDTLSLEAAAVYEYFVLGNREPAIGGLFEQERNSPIEEITSKFPGLDITKLRRFVWGDKFTPLEKPIDLESMEDAYLQMLSNQMYRLIRSASSRNHTLPVIEEVVADAKKKLE
jgi:DNA primase